MLKKLTVLAGALIMAVAPSLLSAQAPPLTQKLGVDPGVIVGKLPNGFTYYIRKNGEPAKRAELRLVVNAGSILEDDKQLGYAHFVEHMAFNGTTHFKKNDLVHYLESIGLRFGADLNASTDFDETVYELSVPTDTARIVETAFLILEDWAHGQLFDSTEVVNERGVVLEEWRTTLGAGERMMRKQIPVLLKGSKYVDRIPIGTPESIQSAQPSGLRSFYADWYRPDLMAVVVVGDVDVPTVEKLIKDHFGGIPAARNPRPRATFGVPANTAPLVSIVTDPEASSTSVSVDIKHPTQLVTTVGEYRRNLVEGLYFAMINARLREVSLQANPPFIAAGVSSGNFIGRSMDAFSFGAAVKDGGVERGLDAVLAEIRRADQFGFLESELTRAKENMLRAYERAYAERAKTNSDALVGELVRNYLEQEDIPGIEAEYTLVQQLMPGIPIAEVNALVRDWITDDNRVIAVSAPAKTGVTVPTEAQVLAVIDRASKTTVTAYTENVSDEALVPSLPAPGRVVSTSTNTAVNLTEWKLSNGARVLVKPTDFKADEVLFSAWSPGGTSLVSDADYMSGFLASNIAATSGVGKYNQTDLTKKLAGKSVRVTATIGATSENVSGSASPKDLETMFQLIYLKFTAPRLDTAAWLATKSAVENQLANKGVVPQAVFSDSIGAILGNHHFRARPVTTATFAEVKPERAIQIYKERFANAGDFTFLVVGAVNLDSLKPLVEKYLGALPSTGRTENWKDVGVDTPDGVVEQIVRKGTEPQAQTLIAFTAPFKYTPRSRLDMLALTTLGQMWLTDALREQMGGTYSPSLSGGGSRIPKEEAQIFIQYESSPDNVDKLSTRTFAIIDSLRKYPASDADMQKVKEQIVRPRETGLKTNSYWLSNIAGREQAGEDVAGLLSPYDDMVKALTAKEIQDAANAYFNLKRYVKLVLLPEKTGS